MDSGGFVNETYPIYGGFTTETIEIPLTFAPPVVLPTPTTHFLFVPNNTEILDDEPPRYNEAIGNEVIFPSVPSAIKELEVCNLVFYNTWDVEAFQLMQRK